MRIKQVGDFTTTTIHDENISDVKISEEKATVKSKGIEIELSLEEIGFLVKKMKEKPLIAMKIMNM